MRHRIVNGITGFGNPNPAILLNTGKLNKKFANAVMETYFYNHDGFDFDVGPNHVKVGIEPAYQFERLFFIEITRYKPHSRIVRGYAMGYYGTQILKNEKLYFQYKTNGKFKKFVDSWHPILFPKGDK